jgi:hypothetical protein
MRGFCVLLCLLCAPCIPGTPGQPALEGLWIFHGEWQFAPDEINEDGDIHKSATAAVMNFCPQGEFHVATGVIYQSTKSPEVVIGARDGLAIYAGRWTRDGASIHVEYRLVSAELQFRRMPGNVPLDDGVERRSSMEFREGLLRFPFITRTGKTRQMDFLPAARYEKRVLDDFVACRNIPFKKGSDWIGNQLRWVGGDPASHRRTIPGSPGARLR